MADHRFRRAAGLQCTHAPRRAVLLIAVVVAALTLLAAAALAEAFPFPGTNGKLFLVSDRDSVDANGDLIIQGSERNREIYSINPDGTGLQRLTNNPADDTRPAVSPDGRRVAFTTDRLGGDDLFIMNANGTGQTRVTDRGAPDREPSFSADGQRLAYSVVHASTLPSGKSEGDIWTVNVDGTETTRLTFDRELDEFDPAFSPDGSRIAFVAATPGGPTSSRDIVIMDSDGSNVTNLTLANGGSGFEDTDPSFSPDGQSIAFSSNRGGGTEIWVMDVDGGSPTQLTDRSGADEHPAFSPDGAKIAFTARRGGSTDVYTMDASDGTGQTRLTDDAPLDEEDQLASWQPVPPAGQLEAYIDSGPGIVGSNPNVSFTYSGSTNPPPTGFRCKLDGGSFNSCPASGISYANLADGKHTFSVRAIGSGNPDPNPATYSFEIDTTVIVFASGTGNASEIFRVNPDGTGRVRLTTNAAGDTEPALSPDGAKVVFVSNRDGDDEIFVMNADGTGPVVQLTTNSASDGAPAYSPDGSKIAFVSRRTTNPEVYVMNANGTAPTNLTSDLATDGAPSFSGDGAKIAFESDRAAGNTDIYSMNANGSAPTRLTTAAAAEKSPDFSPDSSRIAFTRNVIDPGGGLPTNDDVFVMNANGSGPVNITNHPRGIDDREPSYKPDGAKIAYQDQGDIYINNPDGTGRTRVTSVAEMESAPDWGPAAVDLVPPETRIDTNPGAVTNDPTPTFTFSSSEAGSSFECRVDSKPFQLCSSPHTTAALSDGAHSFSVRATDRAGNTDPTPAVHDFVVDSAAPDQPTFTATNPTSPANDNTPRIRGVAAATVEIYTSADCSGAPVASGTGAGFSNPGIEVTVADDSTTTFYATTADALGSSSGCSTDSITYVEDSTGPETTIDRGPSDKSNDASPRFHFSADEPGSSFECRLDSGGWRSCSSPNSYDSLDDGRHKFKVRATDAAGNRDPTAAVRKFKVDATVGGSASAKRMQKQRGSKILVRLKVRAKEDLTAKVRGKIEVENKSYKLRPGSKSLQADQKKSLTLKLKSRSDRRTVAGALSQGGKGTAKLTAKLTDQAGNKKSKKLTVKLRG